MGVRTAHPWAFWTGRGLCPCLRKQCSSTPGGGWDQVSDMQLVQFGVLPPFSPLPRDNPAILGGLFSASHDGLFAHSSRCFLHLCPVIKLNHCRSLSATPCVSTHNFQGKEQPGWCSLLPKMELPISSVFCLCSETPTDSFQIRTEVSKPACLPLPFSTKLPQPGLVV